MKRYTSKQIDELVEILKNDGVISVPTDTVYGVCARAISQNAQENLRNVKHRPQTKAFPLMCSDEKMIKTIAEVDEKSEKIIRAFMPGPLTIVLKKKDSVPSYVNGGMQTLAIRMATSIVLEDLINQLDSPIFMTSANQSGEPVCTNLDEIERNCPDLSGMLEGDVQFGQASTIVDCSGEEIKILREGPITLEQINEVLK